MEAMDIMICYMMEDYFPLETSNSLNRIHWTAQNKIFKGNKIEPSF